MVIHGTTDNASVTANTPAILVDSAGRVATAGPTGSSANQVQGNVAAAATDAGNPVKVGAVYNSTLPTYTNGQRSDLQAGTRGSLNVQLFGVDSTNGVAVSSFTGDGLTASTNMLTVRAMMGVLNGAGSFDRLAKPNAVSRLLSSAATTNATVVKASAGNLHRIVGNNTVASKRYLKFYNKATAPTVGTDTPVLTIVILASAPFDIDLGALGQNFGTGIGYAITGAAADADTTAIGSGDIECMNITYS